jgi:hypothetical protein
LSTEIRFADRLSDDERKTLFEWAENVFGDDDAKYRWRPKDYHFITEEDGRVVSHVGVLKDTVRAGGQDVMVGGVGGVVTIPEAQGRHLVHAGMRRASEFMCAELGVEFGMLFCLQRLVPFYARQGWQLVEETVEFEQPAGKVVSPFRVMILPCGASVWPAGNVEVGGFPW